MLNYIYQTFKKYSFMGMREWEGTVTSIMSHATSVFGRSCCSISMKQSSHPFATNATLSTTTETAWSDCMHAYGLLICALSAEIFPSRAMSQSLDHYLLFPTNTCICFKETSPASGYHYSF